MQNVRPWQMVLFVAAVAAMAFGLWWSLGRGPRAESTNRALLVDVTTGQLYEFVTRKRGVIIPERNPDTGKYALFPVSRNDGGEWVVDSRYLSSGALEEVEGEVSRLDVSSGRVDVSEERPKKVNAAKN